MAEEKNRLVDLKKLCEYTGLGTTRAREFGRSCGAVVKFGTRSLYDLRVIDSEIDQMRTEQNQVVN